MRCNTIWQIAMQCDATYSLIYLICVYVCTYVRIRHSLWWVELTHMHTYVCNMYVCSVCRFVHTPSRISIRHPHISWLLCYSDSEGYQSRVYDLLRSRTDLEPHTMKLKMKCMVITFFIQEGLVYTRSVPDGRSVGIGTWKSRNSLLWCISRVSNHIIVA